MTEVMENKPQLPACVNHPDREAMGACNRCGKPVCDQCSEWLQSRLYCISCYTEAEFMFAAKEIPDKEKLDWYEKPQNHASFIILGVIMMLSGIMGAKMLSPVIGWIVWGAGCIVGLVTSGFILIGKIYDKSTKILIILFILLVVFLFFLMFIGN